MSSESCSFQSIGARSASASVYFLMRGCDQDDDHVCPSALRYYREVLPGEIVQLSKHGVKSLSVVPRPEGDVPAFCIFEYVYFARPDSIFEGLMIHRGRFFSSTCRIHAKERMFSSTPPLPCRADGVHGAAAVREAASHRVSDRRGRGQHGAGVCHSCSARLRSAGPSVNKSSHSWVSSRRFLFDLVLLPVPRQSGLPYIEVLCKNRYVGRTFIQPNTRLRQLGVAKKFGALSDNFAGKRVVLVDDSIVRGNTISPIIKLLKEAGATEVCRLTVIIRQSCEQTVINKRNFGVLPRPNIEPRWLKTLKI